MSGHIRLECWQCDRQLDGIESIPPGWTEIKEVRSYEQSCEPVPLPGDVVHPNLTEFCGYRNKYGDTVLDWQTHFGLCPDCQAEEEVT